MEVQMKVWQVVSILITSPLQAVLPVMLAIFVSFLITPQSSSLLFSSIPRTILFLYSLTECIFYLIFLRMLQRSQERHPAPPCTPEQRRHLFERIRQHDPTFSFLDGWFQPCPFENIGQIDLLHWLAWAFFDRRIDELSIEEVPELHSMSDAVQSARCVRLPKGSNGNARLLRLNLDPVVAHHRPLVYYLATILMQTISHLILQLRGGFRRHGSHWIRLGSSASSKPIVFVHGVGMGLATYLPFLLKLSRSTSTIILLELGHVSMRLHLESVPQLEQIARSATDLLQEMHTESALWVGHSLGSFIVAAVNRLRPDLVDSMVLIEPVCLLLWEADLVANFCYRKPITPMQVIQHYHISRELWISRYFHRHFWWRESVMFTEDMPARSRVFIARLDDIYHPERIIQHCVDSGVPVNTFEKFGHGRWILDKAATTAILSAIDHFIRTN